MIWNLTEVLNALYGGLLIGLAVMLFINLNGRIAGISGIFAGLLNTNIKQGWRWAFIIGLLAAPFVYALFFALPSMSLQAGPWLTALAGLLVGIGTRLSNGCTSGHGVCGIARLSKRSIAATLTFMAAGIATVFFMRHGLV